jgi:hypothetical protein
LFVAEAVIYPGLEGEIEVAERQRLIAHSVADLHLVKRFIELGALRDDAGEPFSYLRYDQEVHCNSNLVLRPNFIRSGMEGGLLTGFMVGDAVLTGGATHTLVYDIDFDSHPAKPNITLAYEEFVTMTTTPDEEMGSEADLEEISRDARLTEMLVRRSSAALHATTTTRRQKQQYAAQARRRERRLSRPLL